MFDQTAAEPSVKFTANSQVMNSLDSMMLGSDWLRFASPDTHARSSTQRADLIYSIVNPSKSSRARR